MSLAPRHPFLRSQALNRVFDNTVASYKFFWFLAVLELSRTSNGQLSLHDVFVEMAAQSWHPANLFRLNFDTKDANEKCVDQLQGVLREIAEKEAKLADGLRPNSSLMEIRVRLQGYVCESSSWATWFLCASLVPLSADGFPEGLRVIVSTERLSVSLMNLR